MLLSRLQNDRAPLPGPATGYHERPATLPTFGRRFMRTTIASSEIFGVDPDGADRRLTLAVGAPRRREDASGWQCRVAVADVLRPTTVVDDDSLRTLARALARIRESLGELRAQGWSLSWDCDGREPLDAEAWPLAGAGREAGGASGAGGGASR